MAPQHPTTIGYLGGVPADAVRAARASWQWLADQSIDDRVPLGAHLSWRQGYLRGYRHAHRRFPTQLAATLHAAGRPADLLAAATRAAVLGTRVDMSDPPSPAHARARAGRLSQPSGTTREVR